MMTSDELFVIESLQTISRSYRETNEMVKRLHPEVVTVKIAEALRKHIDNLTDALASQIDARIAEIEAHSQDEF